MPKNNCLTDEKLERIRWRLAQHSPEDLILFKVDHREPKRDGDPTGEWISGAWRALQKKVEHKWGVDAFVRSAQRGPLGAFALGLVVSPQFSQALLADPSKTKELLNIMADGSWLAPNPKVSVLGPELNMERVLELLSTGRVCEPQRCACSYEDKDPHQPGAVRGRLAQQAGGSLAGLACGRPRNLRCVRRVGDAADHGRHADHQGQGLAWRAEALHKAFWLITAN